MWCLSYKNNDLIWKICKSPQLFELLWVDPLPLCSEVCCFYVIISLNEQVKCRFFRPDYTVSPALLTQNTQWVCSSCLSGFVPLKWTLVRLYRLKVSGETMNPNPAAHQRRAGITGLLPHELQARDILTGCEIHQDLSLFGADSWCWYKQ